MNDIPEAVQNFYRTLLMRWSSSESLQMRIRRRGLLSGFPDKAMQEPQVMAREGHDL
jgi:hypothetical protein